MATRIPVTELDVDAHGLPADQRAAVLKVYKNQAAHEKMLPYFTQEFRRLERLFMGGKLPKRVLYTRAIAFIDEYIEKVGVKELAICKAGCSGGCCSVPVTIMEIEALHIAELTKTPIKRAPAKDKHTPCPFLGGDNMCKIYNHRPIVCRSFFTFDDVKYCHDDVNHIYIDAQAMGPVFATATLIGKYLGTGGGDIRDYFKGD